MTVSPPNNTADLGDLSYVPSLTHRVTIALSGSAPATGTNTPTGATSSVASVPMTHPVNAIYDFIPATGAPVTASDFSREIVSVDNCENCHRQLGGVPGLSAGDAAAGFHGGSRNETHYCVICHTDQRRYGQTEATSTANGAIRTFTSETRIVDGRTIGNFPNYIHKIHMGPLLVNQNYDYAGVLPAGRHLPAGHPQLHVVPRRLEHVAAHDQDQGRRQLEDEPGRAGLRRLPRRHQLRDRHRRHAEGRGGRPDAVEHQRQRPRPPRGPAARRLAVRALPQVERHASRWPTST